MSVLDRLRPLLVVARRGAADTRARLAVYALLALAASWSAAGQVGGLNDFYDAHLVQPYEDGAVRTVVQFHQLPLWNPWVCGGTFAPGGPYARFDSPAFLPALVFGARRAEGVVFWILLLLGMEGCFRWARLRSGSNLGAFLAAPAFALNGFYGLSWSNGWIIFVGFELAQWLMLGVARLARGELAGVGLVAVSMCLMLGFGGTYPVPLCSVLAAFELARGMAAARARKHWRRASVLAVASGLFAVGACAFRLWPVLETMASAPRVMAGAPSHSLAELSRMLFWMSPTHGGGGDTDAIMFIGPAILVLVLAAGLAWRRALVPLLFFGLSMWLASGYWPHPAPSAFALLRELPIFGALRYPERFLVPGTLFIVELAAIGVGAALARARRVRWMGGVAVGLCVAAAAGWGLQAVESNFLSDRSQLVPLPAPIQQPFAQSRGNRWGQSYFLWMDRGSIACGEAFPTPMSELLRGDLPQEEYLADPSTGSARRLDWSPNRIEVAVDAAAPAELRVNQNWHPGWRSSVGRVFSRDGLLAVQLPAGQHHVVLRFLPRSALGGGVMTVLSLGLLGWLAHRSRRRPVGAVQLLAAAAAPLLVGVLILALWKQPPAPPVLTNPDRAPIIVSELPPAAVAVHAQFEVPVELVAATIPAAPDADGIVHFELYWRVSGDVPRAAGIFVHLDGPTGGFKSADHEVLSGRYFFQTAPRNVLIRDDCAASAADYDPGLWTVRLGLWNVSGDGKRIPVRDASGAHPAEERLAIGTFIVPPRADAGTH
jgi:hypothetical protein